MAYTPHTWNNEVITDAKLNALENGLAAASTLTGTDIDANKDCNGKTFSNLNIGGNSNLLMLASASDTIVTAATGTKPITSDEPLKVFEIWLSPQNAGGSTYRCKYDLVATYFAMYAALYVNDVQVGPTRLLVASSQAYAEDLVLKGGDRVQVYTWGEPGGSGYSTYLQLCADFVPVALSSTPSNRVTL